MTNYSLSSHILQFLALMIEGGIENEKKLREERIELFKNLSTPDQIIT